MIHCVLEDHEEVRNLFLEDLSEEIHFLVVLLEVILLKEGHVVREIPS